jgi:DNA-binding MarR family transcriptional regulator
MARIRERANALIDRELRARGIKGIVPHHGAVLAFLLRQAEPVPIRAVVEHVGRVKSTVTGTLNTLQRHGYVRKTPCEKDRRITYVALTRKGRALRPTMDEISAILLAQLYGRMGAKERERLVELLGRIEGNLR